MSKGKKKQKKRILSPWKRKMPIYGKNRYYSVINKLKREGKVDDDVLLSMSSISLEDLIALKLELTNRAAGDRYLSYSILSSLPDLVKEATLKYAMSSTRSIKEASVFCGVRYNDYKKLLKEYGVISFFKEEEK